MFLNQAFAIIKIGKSYDEKVSLKACAEHSRSRLFFTQFVVVYSNFSNHPDFIFDYDCPDSVNFF